MIQIVLFLILTVLSILGLAGFLLLSVFSFIARVRGKKNQK